MNEPFGLHHRQILTIDSDDGVNRKAHSFVSGYFI